MLASAACSPTATSPTATWTARSRGRPESISALTPRLVALYRTVKASLKGIRVIVVGYPSIYSGTARSQCVWLSPRERAGLYQLTSRLDTVERQAAATAGVEYVSTLHALAGHELCTNDSWVFPISFECVTDTECAHPLLPGQNAIALSVSRHCRR